MSNLSNQNEQLMTMTSDIVSAHVAHNNVAVSDLPKLIENVHSSLQGLSGQSSSKPDRAPAVPIKDSVKADYLICLGCGAKMKMLKRHISTHHQMTPEEYRKHWGLPADYPIVTVNYSKTRSGLARRIGLGKKRS